MSLLKNAPIKRMRILGVPISVITRARATDCVSAWARADVPKMVFVRDSASLMLAVDDPILRQLHETADLTVADGTPLALLGKLRGYGAEIERIPGADLLDAVCELSQSTNQSHYFYGGKEGVAEAMVARLKERYPKLNVAGLYSPPFRNIDANFELTDDVTTEMDSIRTSGADFIWIGVSSPKQEYLMMKAAPYIGRGVFFGIGAAFDFHSGAVARAPVQMRKYGLEWLHRLFSEPRRLWRRYLILVPNLLWRVAVDEALHLVKSRQ